MNQADLFPWLFAFLFYAFITPKLYFFFSLFLLSSRFCLPALGGSLRYQVSISRAVVSRRQWGKRERGDVTGQNPDKASGGRAGGRAGASVFSLSLTHTYEDVTPGPVRRKPPITRQRDRIRHVRECDKDGGSRTERVTTWEWRGYIKRRW